MPVMVCKKQKKKIARSPIITHFPLDCNTWLQESDLVFFLLFTTRVQEKQWKVFCFPWRVELEYIPKIFLYSLVNKIKMGNIYVIFNEQKILLKFIHLPSPIHTVSYLNVKLTEIFKNHAYDTFP